MHTDAIPLFKPQWDDHDRLITEFLFNSVDCYLHFKFFFLYIHPKVCRIYKLTPMVLVSVYTAVHYFYFNTLHVPKAVALLFFW